MRVQSTIVLYFINWKKYVTFCPHIAADKNVAMITGDETEVCVRYMCMSDSILKIVHQDHYILFCCHLRPCGLAVKAPV